MASFPCLILATVALVWIVPNVSAYMKGCYYTNWSQYRQDKGKYTPENYEPGLCSHIFYAFASMNDDFSLKTFEANDEEMYKKINDYKNQNQDLKTLISFAGYTFSQKSKDLIKKMVSNQGNREKFIHAALDFVKKYNFNGIDLDWEFPEADDKANFADFVKDLSKKFHQEKLLVSAAVSSSQKIIDAGYDVPALAEMDFINLMSYDFHGAGWEQVTGFNSPLFDRNNDKLSMSSAADYWAAKGLPKEKIMVGFGTYGRSWTLSDPQKHDVGAPGTAGQAGPYTKEAGTLAYYGIVDMLNSGGKRYFDDKQKVPYVVKDNQWVGYDDVESFKLKIEWLKKAGYGGAFIWDLSMDDFSGAVSNGQKYPLMRAIKDGLN